MYLCVRAFQTQSSCDHLVKNSFSIEREKTSFAFLFTFNKKFAANQEKLKKENFRKKQIQVHH